MKKIFFLILFPLFGWTQDSKTDSLKFFLKTAAQDTNRVNALLEVAKIYKKANPDSALDYCRKALKLSAALNFKKGISSAHHGIGFYNFSKGNYDLTLLHYDSSLRISRELKDSGKIAGALNNIARVYEAKGDHEKSLKYYLESVKLAELIQSKAGIATACLNIGNLYLHQSNEKKAMEYYSKSLDISRELHDSLIISMNLANISIIFRRQGKYEDALAYQMQANAIREKINDVRGLINGYSNVGRIYMAMKKFDLALELYYKALEGNIKAGSKLELAITYDNIGSVYFEKKEFRTAIDFFSKSLSTGQQIGAKEIIRDAHLHLAGAYENSGNYEKAYTEHKMYSGIKDSILNEESSKQIAEMQTKYETEKKEQQITLLEKDKEIQNAEVRRQKFIILFVVCGLLLVSVLSVFIFRERKKSEKLLLNILPVETARELKRKSKATAKHYESVTVMFTDFKGFTTIAEKLSAEELVSELDFLFKKFDEIISKYDIEKIKTIGDAYMCVSGLPTPNSNHAENIISAALEIIELMNGRNGETENGRNPRFPDSPPLRFEVRIGIHSGPVTAGVVGDKKFAYDIWGDTVNTASRMESSGEAGKINISGATHELVKEKFTSTFRGKIPAKNKGEIEMYFVEQS